MEWESTLTARLKEAARVERRGGSAEKQEWEEGRRFGERIVVEKKEEALRTAKEWDLLDTVWTDGSRQEDGAVGAACVWRSQRGGGPDAASSWARTRRSSTWRCFQCGMHLGRWSRETSLAHMSRALRRPDSRQRQIGSRRAYDQDDATGPRLGRV